MLRSRTSSWFHPAPGFVAFLMASLGAATTVPAHAQGGGYTFLDDAAEAECNLSFTASSAASGRLRLAFDYGDDGNTYLLDCVPSGASFRLVQGGKSRLLASAPIAWKARNAVTLQRRTWLMRLIVNGKVVLTGYDGSRNDGKFGVQATGWKWEEPRVQPVEAVRFDDDFTRAGSAGDSNWQTPAGKWQLTASSEKINAGNAEMSSNPFAYEALAAPRSLATAGRWFWDNYDARVAVRPTGKSVVGLAAYVQDPKNYLAFLWSSTDGPAARRLVRVRDGVTQDLATAKGAFLPRQWYQLGVRTSPGYIEAIVDGVPVLRARDDSFGQGGIGLISQNESAVFDDVAVRSYDFYRLDFQNSKTAWTPEQGGAWQPVGGQWSAQEGPLLSRPAPGNPGARWLLAGRTDWDGYRVLISAKASPGAAGGLVAGYRDDKNYMLFRWAGSAAAVPFKGRQQIVDVVGGKAQVLRDAPLSLGRFVDREGFVRFAVDWKGETVAVAAGGEILAQASRNALAGGQFGLWAQGAAPVSFKDPVVLFPPAPEPPKVATRMEDDSYMVGWASPSGEWPPTPSDKGLEFWNTGDFFGDTDLDFPWRSSWVGPAEVALRARRGEFRSGYVLGVARAEDRQSLNFTLNRDGKVLASGRAALADLGLKADEDKTISLHAALQGRVLTLSYADKPLLSYADTAPPTGTALAVASRETGARIRADRLRAASANRDDYTFTEAPTDFYAPQGEWSVFSRWPCYGDWSFFGGKGLAATLWSKRTYSGDIVVEMYSHNQMDLPKEVGYSHPGDLNITVGGDGKNPSSGYSFIVGGVENTRSRLMRGNVVVADTDKPEARFEKPINHYNRWHKRWVYIRVEARHTVQDGKTGVLLTLTSDDAPILSYFDPNPLGLWKSGGRVAFWTVDGTIMIARAKIECEKPGLKSLPAGLIDPGSTVIKANAGPFEPRPVVVDNLPSSVVTPEKGGWRITNPGSGGAFETVWNQSPVRVTDKTKLSFDVQLPPDVKLDVYVRIGEELKLVELSGGQRVDAVAPSLGKMNLTPAANGWKTVRFDLGAALAKALPGQSSWQVDEVLLGARHGDVYRYVGFDGNAYGDSFAVANWKLGE